jgi:hypothetical protein
MSFFNEFMVSMYLYLLMSLTDFMGPNPLRDDIGWALLVTVVSTVAVNLIKATCLDVKWVASVMRSKWGRKKGK